MTRRTVLLWGVAVHAESRAARTRVALLEDLISVTATRVDRVIA